MTICVSVKTQDGIVLGTDSMSTVTLYGSTGMDKTYSNARKLAQIGDLPVGVFIYGAGNLGPRTVFSHILEYSKANRNLETTVQGIAEGLVEHILPEYERFADVSEYKPVLGLYVAGYSPDSTLPEEWEIEFSSSTTPYRTRDIYSFGASWRGIPFPFSRLFEGYDPRLVQALEAEGISRELLDNVFQNGQFAAQVIFDAMPLQDAINFAVYVLRTTIGFTSFEVGRPSCGGQLQIAVISEDKQFQWVNEPQFRIPEDTNEWA